MKNDALKLRRRSEQQATTVWINLISDFCSARRNIQIIWIFRVGGRYLQGNRRFMISPPASMTSRLASVTFKMASKVFIEETDKNFDFITEILFRFLGFGDFKVSIVIENLT